LANTGDFKKAEKYFKHCCKLETKSVPAHFGLGKILHQFEKFSDAIKQFKMVIDLDKEHFKAYC